MHQQPSLSNPATPPANSAIPRRDFFKLALLPLLSGFFPSAFSAFAETGKKKPNIVFIFSDEIDFSYLGCYGGKYATPNLDRLAYEGMRFDNAYCASPMCTPSRFSVLTGGYPSRCEDAFFKKEFPPGENPNIAWNSFINSDTRTLPRVLAEAGYVTGMAGKWHLGEHGPDWHSGLKENSDPALPEVDALLKERQANVESQLKKDSGFDAANSAVWANFDEEKVAALAHHNIPWITKGAIEFLRENGKGEKPFFLYVAASTVHGPGHHLALGKDRSFTPEGRDASVAEFAEGDQEILAGLEGKEEWEKHQRTGMAELDRQVGKLFETLQQLGIEENTIVIYMPDHNVEPGKATCYEKGFRVPLFVKWPGVTPPCSSASALVQGPDLFKTIAEIAGVPEEKCSTPDAHSFFSVLRDPAKTGTRDSIYYESGFARGIKVGDYKYIAYRPSAAVVEQMKSGKKSGAFNYLDRKKQGHSQVAMMHFPGYFDQDQLYDLGTDPFEQKNLAGDPAYAVVLADLKGKLQAKLDTFPIRVSLERIPYLDSAEFQKQCAEQKALGTDFVEWLTTDHPKIEWPPAKDTSKGFAVRLTGDAKFVVPPSPAF